MYIKWKISRVNDQIILETKYSDLVSYGLPKSRLKSVPNLLFIFFGTVYSNYTKNKNPKRLQNILRPPQNFSSHSIIFPSLIEGV